MGTLNRRINSTFAPFYGPANLPGRALYVAKSGSDSDNDGLIPSRPLLTIAQALSLSEDFDEIFVGGGEYDEALDIPVGLTNIGITGLGGRGGVIIAPTTSNETGLTNEADDVVLRNLSLRGDGTGSGLINRGSRLSAYGCRFGTAGAVGATLTEGTAAQVTALTHGVGHDLLFDDCVFEGVATGVLITATDEGEMYDIHFVRCWFHDLPTASVSESGGTAANRFRDLLIEFCHFGAGDPDVGTAPTKWMDLDDSNSNTGQVANCTFPTAINGGANLVSTAITWVGNMHTGGIATTQPS